MVTFTTAFICGIAVVRFVPFFPISLSILCVFVMTFLFIRYRTKRKEFLLILIAFLFGLLLSFIQNKELPEQYFPDNEVYLQGTIIDVPERLGGKVNFTLDTVYLEGVELEGKIRLVMFEENFEEDSLFLLSPGDRIEAFAKLREPRSFLNPGVYSYNSKGKGIIATGYLKYVRVEGRDDGLSHWIYRKRQELGQIMENSLSKENASFHKAIIVGLKKGISRDMRDSFSATGLAHLLSISGTHFGLLAFIIFSFIRGVIKSVHMNLLTKMTLYVTPTQAAVFLTLPVLVLYALISGASIPTVRSLIMVSIFMLALFLGRKGQWLNSLSIAAFIILFLNPKVLFEVSFLLSFLAVFSIGYVLEKSGNKEDEDAEYKPPDSQAWSPVSLVAKVGIKIRTAILITVSAVLGTAPVIALVFKQFPLISPLTNLIVTPIVCFIVLPLGFLSGFFALLFHMSQMPFSGLLDEVTYFSLKLVKVFSLVPFSNLHVHDPSFVYILFYYAAIIFFLKAPGWWRALPFVCIVCIYFVGPYLNDNELKVTFMDVGQGDAAVVELPDKKVMLIDGGTQDPDAGRSVVAPFLWSKGIRSIDYLVASHLHSDHFGGFIYVMDNFNVREIWLNGRMTDEADELLQKIKEKDIYYRVPARGDILNADGYTIQIFHTYDGFFSGSPRGELSDQNNDSLVMKIESDNGSLIFTGDIEIEAEENLNYFGDRLKSDILKVPHHGSRTSSSEAFIKAVKPDIAVISAGKNNTFKHPHKETMVRYKDAGVKILRTDTNGAVTITMRPESHRVEIYEDGKLKEIQDLRDEIRNLRLLY